MMGSLYGVATVARAQIEADVEADVLALRNVMFTNGAAQWAEGFQ